MVAKPPRVDARPGAIAGARAVLDGIPLLLRHRTLRNKLIKSLLANALAFLALFVFVVWAAFALTSGWVEGIWYAAALGWLARAAVIAGLVVLAPVLYALLADLLMPIVHGPIFEAARKRAGGPPFPEISGGFVGEVRSVALDLRRLVKFLLLSALLLLLNFLPIVGNLAYAALQFLLAAHTMGWDLLAYHFEGHGLDYRQQRHFIRHHLPLVLGVGAVAELLCLIPLAQLLFVTTNVAGAGVLSARLDGAPANPRK